jgi:hypothetical protein
MLEKVFLGTVIAATAIGAAPLAAADPDNSFSHLSMVGSVRRQPRLLFDAIVLW